MAVYAKKRKPFIVRFIAVIFWIVLTLALVLGALWCYLFFAKKVNYISALGQMATLSVEVDESAIILNPPSQNDLTNIKAKMQLSSLSSGVEISDKEFCAYLNDQIQNEQIILNFAGIEQKAKDAQLEILQVVFEKQSGDVLANVNITFKFSTSAFQQKLFTFPLSLFASNIPDVMYVVANGEILSTPCENYNYSLKPTEIKLNTLNASDSQNLINFTDVFVRCGNAESLNTQILQLFCDNLIGNNQNPGLHYQFSSKVKAGYETSFSFSANGVFNVNIDEAKYEVKVVQTLGSNQNVNAGVITGTGSEFLYGTSTTLEVTENNGYKFLGWYDHNGGLKSTAKSLAIANITEDVTIYAKFEYITKNISYNLGGKICDNNNPKTYNISNGTIVLQPLVAVGYDFLGWYDNPSFTGNKITQITASTMVDYSLYAKWELKVYSITYSLNDGTVPVHNPENYTIETETFTLNNPIKTDTTFLGWTEENHFPNKTTSVVIEKGKIVGNLNFVAHYESDQQTFLVNLVVDGKNITSFDADADSVLTKETINSKVCGSDYGMTGYSVKSWFKDSDKTTPYNEVFPNAQLTLYGSWTYFIDNMLFLPYLDKFNYANNKNTSLNFDSEEELVAWIDYVLFYHIGRNKDATTYPTFNLTYKSGTSQQLTDYVDSVYKNVYKKKVNYQTVSFSYFCSGQYFFMVNKNEDIYNINKMGTLEVAGHTKVEPQIDNSLTIKNNSQRTENVFPIDNVSKTVGNITNTEQLVRVLEQGYRPDCVSNSSADKIYKKARNVLKEICNDEMTDVQKLRAIYEWLTLQVQYDRDAVDLNKSGEISGEETRLYASWFPEGVFNNGIAVCEGYAKSAVIMARIEGIPIVYVTGNNHAWNKVQVDGKWYEFDATHGDSLVQNYGEMTTYTHFLFKSSVRPAYVAQEYSGGSDGINLVCITDYNFYANTKYVYGDSEFDLSINSQQELNLLLNYVKTNKPSNISSTTYSAEFISDLTIYNSSIQNAGITNFKLLTKTENNKKVYVLIINK